MNVPAPDPLPHAALGRALAALAGGVPYKTALEALLLELDDEAADRLMQLQREARGTWLLALCTPRSGATQARALFVGNALSGAHVPLSHHGFEVTLLDSSALRLRWARLRNEALSPGSSTLEVMADGGVATPEVLAVDHDVLAGRVHLTKGERLRTVLAGLLLPWPPAFVGGPR